MSVGENALLRAIAAHIGPIENVRVQSEPWWSATFSGARHCIWFDAKRGAHLDAFRHDLHTIEFALAGGFVADVEIIERTVSGDIERLGLAVLTIDEKPVWSESPAANLTARRSA
jgi:hypothetical protein